MRGRGRPPFIRTFSSGVGDPSFGDCFPSSCRSLCRSRVIPPLAVQIVWWLQHIQVDV